jgi:hypothetical protein
MDDYIQAPDISSDSTSRDGGRPSWGKTGMLALALVPLAAAMGVVGFVLAGAAGGAPAGPPRADDPSLGPYPVIRYPSVPSSVTGPAATATPGPSTGGGPDATGGSGPGSGGGPGGGGGGGTGGGGTGGGGGGGGIGGGGGGGGSGGGQTTTTQPPPPPPTITSFDCNLSGRTFACTMTYQAPGAVQISWTKNSLPVAAWDGQLSVSSTCPYDAYLAITVTVSGATGTAPPRTGDTYCPERPCPKICPVPPLAPHGADLPMAWRRTTL